MNTSQQASSAVLVPGHWLGAWAWDGVAEHLSQAGVPTVALTLPGLDPQDPERASRTVEDQARAIEAALEGAAPGQEGAVLVVHSGGNWPASVVLDRRPDLVRHVVWVDSGPVAPGQVFAPDAPDDLTEFPLPAFEQLGAQASLDGLGAEQLETFRQRAVPEPGPVLRQAVALEDDDARFSVPTTIVCCSIASAQLRELAGAGHPMFSEVTRLGQVDFVDLPTGHWPMWSRPGDLAEVIAGVVAASADA